jgi:pimeloyl-ACP methyl ester carboxylesterase
MIKILQIFGCVFCLLIQLFLVVNKVEASNYLFDEEFNTRDENMWSFITNGGVINFDKGIMTLGSSGPGFPVVYSKIESIFSSSEDSTFEIKFKYNTYGRMGDGISIGFTGNTNYPFYQFSLWRDAGSQFTYNDFNRPEYGLCNPSGDWSDTGTRVNTGVSLDNNWHVLKIQRINTWYKIFLDEDKNPVPIYIAYGNQCVPKNIILGNPLSAGGIDWNSISLDYIRIYRTNDPPPTPTPVTLFTKKIIIIPGLGASWNTRAMVYNDTVPDDAWQMTPFVNNYQGLIETLEKGGLVKNEDFYVWNYDWRKPVSEIVGKLDNFINQNISADEKVDLVGHSLGGLTSRIWAQNNSDDPRLDKVIALGGPQQGALDAYNVWNGAVIPQGDWVENIAINVLVELQRKNFSTVVETLRNYAPVLKDLIPTFDFVKKNGKIVKVTDLKSVNNYLITKNSILGGLSSKIGAIIGTGVETKEWINLGKTNIFNQILGYWPDGEPISFNKGNGDGTVLFKSAGLGQNDIQLTSKHGDLVTDGITNILSQLDLSGLEPVTVDNVDLSGKLVFFIGSPATLNIICDGGSTAASDESGFALVDGLGNKVCRVKVIGTDNGTYHLVTGKVGNEESWRYYENEIKVGTSEVVTIEAISGRPSYSQNLDYWYELILRDINLLIGNFPKDKTLKSAKDAVLKKNVDLLMERIFSYRESSKETVITGRILDNLHEILIGKYQKYDGKIAKIAWKLVKNRKGIIDTLSTMYSKNGWKPSTFMSINYQKMTDLEKEGDMALVEGNVGRLYADMILISNFVSHFW